MHVARIVTVIAFAGAVAVPTVAFAAPPTPAAVVAAPAEIYVAFPQAVAPSVGVDGTLPFLTWPAAQNLNGYEGDGYRVYLDRTYDGPGTYTMTLQKVGPGASAAYPGGTVVVDENGLRRHPSNGNDKQVVTVLPALDAPVVDGGGTAVEGAPVVPPTSQEGTDEAAAGDVSAEVLASTDDADVANPRTTVNALPRARTGSGEQGSITAAALGAIGAGTALAAAVAVRRRRARA